MKVNFKNIVREWIFNLKWRCNACDEENFSGDYFCNNCKNTLPKIVQNKCDHCGRLTSYSTTYCDSCIDKNIYFDKARSLYSYEEPISALVRNLKYNSKLYLADIFCDEFLEIFFSNFSDTDIITFVPSTEKSLKERGYNQSQILADRLSKKVNLPIYSTAIKIKETSSQVTLNYYERKENLKGVFIADKINLSGKNILLIDDVLTTGSTADSLAKIYKKNKANKVYILTVASVGKIKFKTL